MKNNLRYLSALPLAILPQASNAQDNNGSGDTGEFPERPNIIMILVDDMGYGELSCQGMSDDIHTPNLDLLLNEGVRFTNLYANCTVSSPSRAALLTGQFPDMAGVPGVIRTDPEDSWGFLRQDIETLPERLKKSDYNTAIVGKWHLGLTAPNLPNLRGFDFFHGFLGDMMDNYMTHIRDYQNYMRLNDQVIDPEGHATEIFTDWAIDYIKAQRKEKNPYFLYLAYNAPHDPVQPPVAWLEKVQKREPEAKPKRQKLIALIEHLDDNIGRLYNYLKKTRRLDNTIILFASDNGGALGHAACNGIWRGGKGDMYEGGIRVPGGIYWKGHVSPQVCDEPVMLFDYFQTMCQLAEGEDYKAGSLPSLSLVRVLEGGKAPESDTRHLCWMRREGNMNFGGRDYYAARRGDLKILQRNPFSPYEIYDVRKDSLEKNNIIDLKNPAHKALFKEMMSHVRKAGAIPWQK